MDHFTDGYLTATACTAVLDRSPSGAPVTLPTGPSRRQPAPRAQQRGAWIRRDGQQRGDGQGPRPYWFGAKDDAMRDDQQLIAQCLQGRAVAFDELVRRYQVRLYPPMLRLLGCEEDARDVVQEAFLLAFQSLDTFQRGCSFYTWLYRIAFNRAVSLRRKKRLVGSIEACPGDRRGDVADPSLHNRPSDALERAEQNWILQQALNSLPSADRTLLIMRDMESKEYSTMAKALQVPVGTIRSRLHRARKKLRDLLLNRQQTEEL